MIPQLQREATVTAPMEKDTPIWSLPTRIGFRFVFCYYLLYIAPGPVGSLGPYNPLTHPNLLIRILHQIVPWVGMNILHLKGNLAEIPNGSGDELYDYVLLLCLIVFAAIITAVWSLLDRKRPNYQHLHQWLRLLMRMTVGWGMLGYGVKKLLGAQFPPPNLAKLVQPIGQSTPLGMLWAFMGVSQPYSFFGGLGEALGGALIILPGLVTLGSIVSIAMMTNVLMLNVGYDVPRKILSFHLILMCLFLLIPDFKRLVNVFLLNRRADPVPEVPLFKDKLTNWAAMLLPIVFGVYVAFVAGRQSIFDAKDLTATLPPPIRGIWRVDELVVDGTPHPPLLTDATRWQNVIFDAPKVLTIQLMDGRQAKYAMELEEGQKTFVLHNENDPYWKATLALEYPQPDQMILQGDVGFHRVNAKLKRIDVSDPEMYPLMNRGFHWVNPNVNNH